MSDFGRRDFLLAAGAAAAGVGLAPRRGWTAERVDLGDAELLTLSDGHLTLPGELVFGPAPREQLPEVLAPFGISPDQPLTPPCNVTLLRRGAVTALFDCGAGPAFQATAGRLPEALDTAGLAAEDITHVIFTHGHPDHLWGVLDDFDEPMFPEARHLMGRIERDYWLDPATIETIGPVRASFAAGARRRLLEMAERIEVFEDGAEVVGGVAAHLTPGHTPGHMAFEVGGTARRAMVVGDAIANHHVALARPGWPTGQDQDPELGARTRERLVARLATEKLPMVGFHLPDGGAGHVERAGEGYRFVPEV